ncbi:P-type conjugative transfer ATPase TrbB [Caulobacter sp. FWC26]|uniref:P-type conjugative transfer ATPase TrbB n=1 Tax=Caulobacter sp. FWC26 TaxID=69665 RepID=UPI000C1484D6|nr:P-type conjugative transfer ATPase TrbB [Caulobacter sp. FWC26]AZS19215.1 P-type conjugative transfer ATPase TrbB [Caulobacter sp. FWC26]
MDAPDPATEARKTEALLHALGPTIGAALTEPAVEEVIVNADGAIWIDRRGSGRLFSGVTMARADAERVLRLVADHAGEVVTHDQPLIGTSLPGGERFQGVYGPVAKGPSFVIRKRSSVILTLDDYVDQAVMTRRQAQVLAEASEACENILIAGGTGSGKTTLANTVLDLPAFRRDRVVVLEDTEELRCAAPDHLALLTRRADPAVTMADLVKVSLRLRPDRIVIGEVRDGSALDLLKAWNTGHPGGLATLHANSAAEALDRLEDLIGEVSQTIPRRAIGQAIGLIAYLTRAPAGRVLQRLVRVKGWREGTGYELEEVETGAPA